jgi:uncharacterized protein (DUF1015 family)
MTKIAPFRAVIYNKEKVKDFSKVVCPPYDIISAADQQYYHDVNPHNLIHIILGKDIPGEDKYRRAAAYFKDWLKNEILIQDERPAIYFYNQQYTIAGEKKSRLGFIARLYLDDKNPCVFGHEYTRLEPKEDRLRLLKNVKANLSPIFVLFSDQKRIIQRVYQQHIQDKKPFIDIVDKEKIVHKVWRLDDKAILDKLQIDMQNKNIFIADGHHRYEVACAYRDEIKKRLGILTGEEDFNYIMAYFTNTESRGLSILPIHRLVRLDSKFDINNLKSLFLEYLDVEEVKDKTRFFFLMEKAGRTEHVLGIYKDKKYWFLRLKNIKLLDRMIADKSIGFRSLDVSILNYIVLKKILGVNLENKEKLIFSHNREELIELVNNEPSCVAFFLNPVKIQQIISLALNNEKMPTKTTYFYPKVLSGLVMNKHR